HQSLTNFAMTAAYRPAALSRNASAAMSRRRSRIVARICALSVARSSKRAHKSPTAHAWAGSAQVTCQNVYFGDRPHELSVEAGPTGGTADRPAIRRPPGRGCEVGRGSPQRTYPVIFLSLTV